VATSIRSSRPPGPARRTGSSSGGYPWPKPTGGSGPAGGVRSPRRRRWVAWWADPDRRRAALLSGAMHLAVLLVVISALRQPVPEAEPTYLIIDIGVPAIADTVVEAPAAAEPAPTTPAPQVADTQVGEPQAAATPEPTPIAPAPAPQTVQPAPPAAAPPAPEPVTVEAPRPPVPAPVRPAMAAPEVPLAPLPATPLPEIAVRELEPTPLAERIPVPLPSVATLVPEPRAIAATPQVSVAAPAPVPLPSVAAQVDAAAPVPIPAPTVAITPARPVSVPDVQASVGAARDVRVTPQVRVAVPTPVPTPRIQAEVGPLPPAPSAPLVDAGTAATASDTASLRDDGVVAGGDAANPGQTGLVDPAATSQGTGAAASPTGSPVPTGSPAIPRQPYARQLERPLAVLVDNVGGVPLSGVRSASTIVEMPVEAGLTRLMLVFDRTDPERVGPVRSAREYFVELAARLDAVLVHDGGSPGALAAIAVSPAPTFNAFSSGELFSRGDGRAPYNLFTAGDALRAAVNRLDLARGRTVTGTIFRPAEEAPEVATVALRFGGGYVSGFRYEPNLNAYRWIRDGAPAVDAAGEAVLVDAVLLGGVDVRPFPNDPEGRVSIPLRGGAATLYLAGKAVEGRWELRDAIGVRFVTTEGEVVDLAPFKTWVALSPGYEARTSAP
jgi:hypothetical protein